MQLVEEYYPAFESQWAAEGRVLPDHVHREFGDFLRCGRLESGFLRVRCGACHAERLVVQASSLLPQLRCAAHGGELGPYVEGRGGSLKRFQWVKGPTSAELTRLSHTIARRVGRFLQRQGLLESDADNSYLGADIVEDESMAHLQGHSITYRIAVGPHQGGKVFTLQTLPACDPDDPLADTVGRTAGFSLHAGVAVKARERDKLERLCRYITRPAVSEQRLSLTPNGKIRYQLKTPYGDGTTHVIFEPQDISPPNRRRALMDGPY